MEKVFGSISFEPHSDFISNAFASNKPSPYTSLSSLYDFEVLPNSFTRQTTLDEFHTVTTGRSSISIADSVDTTHIENPQEGSWSNVAELNTPRQANPINGSEQQDAKLLKVIKSILAYNILDIYRNYVDEIFIKDLGSVNVKYGNGKVTLDMEDFRVRVFSVLRRCLANNTESNIVRIFEALREKYDVKLVEDIPSLGSITHSSGYCKPCVFANKVVNSCKNGLECNFCHFQHKITRRKSAAKENQDASKQAKVNEIAQNFVCHSPSVLRKCQSMEPSPIDVVRQTSAFLERAASYTPAETLGGFSMDSIDSQRDSSNGLFHDYSNAQADELGIDLMQEAVVARCLGFLELESRQR